MGYLPPLHHSNINGAEGEGAGGGAELLARCSGCSGEMSPSAQPISRGRDHNIYPLLPQQWPPLASHKQEPAIDARSRGSTPTATATI